jgi:hypothetical protein
MGDEYTPRPASEIPEWKLEEMIRLAIEQTMRSDIADRALAWLDQRIDAYNRLHGSLQLKTARMPSFCRCTAKRRE